LYSFGGRAASEALVDRVQAQGFGALVVTLDTPVLGNRERDVRHGVSTPPRIEMRNALHLGPQLLVRPAWSLRLAAQGIRTMRGQSGARPRTRGAGVRGTAPGGPLMAASPFSWEDVASLRSRWKGPLLVKGVL